MTKVWEWIKKWAWLIILGLISILALGRKPKWVKQKEQEIKQRDQDIKQAKDQADQKQSDYEGVKKDNDEEIEQANKPEGIKPFDNADDAASYIDEILTQRQRKSK